MIDSLENIPDMPLTEHGTFLLLVHEAAIWAPPQIKVACELLAENDEMES
jgi:hypothetical protein